MTSKSQKAAVNKYDKKNCTRISLKLNRNTDADILKVVDQENNKQGFIKKAIRFWLQFNK